MTRLAKSERAHAPDKDRLQIAKRIFDALCAKYPEKYIALVRPREPRQQLPPKLSLARSP
jgi:hypothetical protein